MIGVRFRAAAVPLLAAALAAAGCGDNRPKTYPVAGKLVYTDGTPVSGATVTFITALGEKTVAARSRVNDDGTFRLTTFEDNDGAVAGEHHVAVSPVPRDEADQKPVPVPPVYADAAKSGLKATVTPETREVTVTLDRKKR